MTSAELRSRFLTFFAARGHTVVPSASLLPQADRSLLFVNAGMVPFKSVFLGEERRGYSRAVSVQKCVRAGGKHNDLEHVGLTGRHHTFFEMLGNFSFGDYFKTEAIQFGWEFLTAEVGLPKDNLLVSVFRDDDEGYEIWHRKVGLDPSRIYRMDEADNFWQMADTGPCGPCSEILLDQGPEVGCGKPTCAVGCSCDRYLEIWNLVFMQFVRDASGALATLPAPSIDTGMGLERLTAASQGTINNYGTDLFQDILSAIGDRASARYGTEATTDRSMQVIADHLRAISFLIADGILPSNEGRGYVLRRILRRAARHGRLLGIHDPFLHELVAPVIQSMGQPYPELIASEAIIARTMKIEEERFVAALDEGLRILDQVIETARAGNTTMIPGEHIFRLYDTFGFPIDLIAEAARDQGFTLDEHGFYEQLDRQRKRAREAGGFGEEAVKPIYEQTANTLPATRFVGYDQLEAKATVLAIIGDEGLHDSLTEGHTAEFVLDLTPFYAEGGGQIGDQGVLHGAGGTVAITQTWRPVASLIVHQGRVQEGRIRTNDAVQAIINSTARFATMRNHTATHILHGVLREVLGPHAKQVGSLVAPDRLRFDFTHLAPLTDEERDRIEHLVNERIRENIPVNPQIMEKDEALSRGALAFFGDKYGDTVRMVEIGAVSKELCGGTHCRRTGDIGSFRLVSESGIAAGVRRIEALTGIGADHYVKSKERELRELAALLKTTPMDLLQKARKVMGWLKERDELIETLRQRLSASRTQADSSRTRTIGPVHVYSQRVENATPADLRATSDSQLARLGSGVIALGSAQDGDARLLLRVSKDLTSTVHAGRLVQALAPFIGGKGGGSPEMGQAGGNNPDGLDRVLNTEIDSLIHAAFEKKTSETQDVR